VPVRVERGGYAMGTVLEVTVEAASRQAAEAAVSEAFASVERLEAIFTSWDPASELSRLNAHAGSGPVEVSPELAHILDDAVGYARQTGGVFDVTVGPLVALWRDAGARGRLPGAQELAAARARVGAEGIQIGTDGRVSLLREHMAVDLAGLAKGWSLDRVGETLAARGVSGAFLSFGQSSLLALGRPHGESGWRVLLGDGRGGFVGVARLRDASLSVSGSFGASTEIEGVRYGHVLDPRTGMPLAHAAQAAVWAPSGALAEALSKALLVLSPDEGLALLRDQPGVEGLLVDEAGTLHTTPGFEAATAFEDAQAGAAPPG